MSEATAVVRHADGITVTRFFPHPPEAVFDAFADPITLGQWWGPPECPIVESSLDFRAGGVWHYRLRSSKTGHIVWSRAVFDEIVPPSRIVFVETSADAAGAVTADRGPAHTTITLAPHDVGTILTVDIRHSSVDEARRAVERGVERGLSRALDQLDLLLQQAERNHDDD